MDVLMSIRPEFVRKILSREKLVEFRTRAFRRQVDRIFIYSSAPEQRIVGSFRYVGSLSGCPAEIWERYGGHSCISKEDFFGYFPNRDELAYAIPIADLRVLDRPVDPFQLIPGFCPPQSFCYWDALPDIEVED